MHAKMVAIDGMFPWPSGVHAKMSERHGLKLILAWTKTHCGNIPIEMSGVVMGVSVHAKMSEVWPPLDGTAATIVLRIPTLLAPRWAPPALAASQH